MIFVIWKFLNLILSFKRRSLDLIFHSLLLLLQEFILLIECLSKFVWVQVKLQIVFEVAVADANTDAVEKVFLLSNFSNICDQCLKLVFFHLHIYEVDLLDDLIILGVNNSNFLIKGFVTRNLQGEF